MKKLLYLLSIALIASCANQKPVNSTKIHVANQLDTIFSGNKLFIKDTTQYDPSFIRGLVEMAKIQTSFSLIDDSLIVNSIANTSPDSIVNKPNTWKYVIPTNLELNKEIRFSTRPSERNFSLILKRINFTNIEYQLIQDGKTIKSGTAILDAGFSFGDEVEGNVDGESIYLKQYNDNEGFESYLKVEIKDASRATYTYCTDEKLEKYETLPMFIRE
jgi:hypothetical protein